VGGKSVSGALQKFVNETADILAFRFGELLFGLSEVVKYSSNRK
jgi:hypothetical protein